MHRPAPLDTPSRMTPEELQTRLLYRDGLMLVVDKPAGIAVHRGPKGGENLEMYFEALCFGLPRAPALAHRLDRDTSGCLVLGRHRKALEYLGGLFKHGRVDKTYWAIVEGGPDEAEGLIDLPLGRLDSRRGWWMKVDPLGLPSQTRWRVAGRGVDADGTPITWLELSPLTGRTHQLRVHTASMGWPIRGDAVYGMAPRRPDEESAAHPALQLLARQIILPMQKVRPPVKVEAPVPAHMRDLMTRCGWVE